MAALAWWCRPSVSSSPPKTFIIGVTHPKNTIPRLTKMSELLRVGYRQLDEGIPRVRIMTARRILKPLIAGLGILSLILQACLVVLQLSMLIGPKAGGD